jgi:hypothetical protein
VGRRGRKGGAQEVFDTRLKLGGENGGEHPPGTFVKVKRMNRDFQAHHFSSGLRSGSTGDALDLSVEWSPVQPV